MSTTKENMLVGPCGCSCGHCLFYLSEDDPAMAELLVAFGYSREKSYYHCQGCRASKGKTPCVDCTKETLFNDLPAAGSSCATYTCSVEHGVDFCYECPEFPCVKLQPCADMAGILPHNLKVFHLCYIKNQGLAEYLKNYAEITQSYYFGKLAVGKGPQLSVDTLKALQAKMEELKVTPDK